VIELDSFDGKSIKALVTDIDGSITDERRRISIAAIEVLRKVEEKGIPVMLASGNILPIAYGLSSFIGITGPVIAENGGVVFYKKEVKYLADRKRCDEAFEMLKSHFPVRKIFSDRWRRAEVAIEPDVNLKKVKELLGEYNLKAESTGYAIHIFEPHMSKFQGVKVACEIFGVDINCVAAFGDSENDIDMIKNCAVGIVPNNATSGLKSNADYVASSPNGEGLKEGLLWLGVL
jgi:phosphoglycolate phosphatase (TIGR01487 family)